MNQVFGVLVLAAWTQTTVRCQYFGDSIGDGRGSHNDELHEEHQIKPLYKYGYWVHDPKTKDVKNHWEHRDGDAVYGSYSLLQPDGHMRVVEYTADKHNGFNAHVKYMYEGHADGGGGGGAAEDFGGGGGDFGGGGNYLDDLPGGHSQIGGGGGRPKQSLSKYYKKPRAEKHGGPAGAYRKPVPNQSRPAAYKKHRPPPPPPSAEQSSEYYGGRPAGGHFDQPRFPSSSSSSGPSEHYQATSALGGSGGGGGGGGSPFGGYSFGDPAAPQSSDHFSSRKYSSSPLTASTESSAYHPAGIQYQSSEHEPVVHRRPDAVPERQPEQREQREQRQAGDSDGDAAAEVRILQKQPPKAEYRFDDPPPYPFEMPEGLTMAAAAKFRPPHPKRHARPYLTTSSSYFPEWFAGSGGGGTSFKDFGRGLLPEDF